MTQSFVEENAPGWLAGRRYGVPATMVADATRHRLAGDWRAACAAARFDVRFDRRAVADAFGVETAARVEDDLNHLVPDLARWHLPRRGRGPGLVEPGRRIVLATYGTFGPYEAEATLWLATPAHLERPQRVRLHVGPLDRVARPVEDWRPARYLWDARATDGLRHRLGGGDRTPFFHRDGTPRSADELPAHAPADDPVALTEWVTLRQDAGDVEDAWRAAGVSADFPEHKTKYRWGSWRANPDERFAMVPALVRSCVDLVPDQYALRTSEGGWRQRIVVVSVGPTLSARLLEGEMANRAPSLPGPLWRRFSELELLRTGRIGLDGLHPLVREAMFPEAGDGDYRPLAGVTPTTVPVRCRGVWHAVGWAEGRAVPRDHTADEVRRERVIRTLGGEVPQCFSVTESWRGGSGRLPKSLRELRHHALSLLRHGDADGFARLLDLGIDPSGVRDRWGRGPLHLLAQIEAAHLVGPLVAAGLPINGRDLKGRTPLAAVLFDGGSADLVAALLDAGADPTIADATDATVLHLVRSLEADAILPRLLSARPDLEARDEYGRTPLMTLVRTDAPAEAVRALLAAGADPWAKDEYSERTVVALAEDVGRDDLDFLIALGRATA